MINDIVILYLIEHRFVLKYIAPFSVHLDIIKVWSFSPRNVEDNYHKANTRTPAPVVMQFTTLAECHWHILNHHVPRQFECSVSRSRGGLFRCLLLIATLSCGDVTMSDRKC